MHFHVAKRHSKVTIHWLEGLDSQEWSIAMTLKALRPVSSITVAIMLELLSILLPHSFQKPCLSNSGELPMCISSSVRSSLSLRYHLTLLSAMFFLLLLWLVLQWGRRFLKIGGEKSRYPFFEIVVSLDAASFLIYKLKIVFLMVDYMPSLWLNKLNSVWKMIKYENLGNF